MMGPNSKPRCWGADRLFRPELTRCSRGIRRVDSPLLFGRDVNGAKRDNPAEIFPYIAGNGHSPVEPFSWSTLQQQGVELCVPGHAGTRSRASCAGRNRTRAESDRPLAARGGSGSRNIALCMVPRRDASAAEAH